LARKARILQILEVAEDLLLAFDNYFSRHPWVVQESGISSRAVGQSVWRLVKNGILDQEFRPVNQPESVLGLIKKRWDKKWRLVTFDIPEKERQIRKSIRNRLQEMGFAYFQRSVWISPLPVAKFVEKLDREIDQTNNFFVFSGEVFDRNPKDLVKTFWPVADWSERSRDLIAKINNKTKLPDSTKKEFWDLVLEHPKVPLELLPNNWPLGALIRSFSRKTR